VGDSSRRAAGSGGGSAIFGRAILATLADACAPARFEVRSIILVRRSSRPHARQRGGTAWKRHGLLELDEPANAPPNGTT
jgi:hypothetical protein